MRLLVSLAAVLLSSLDFSHAQTTASSPSSSRTTCQQGDPARLSAASDSSGGATVTGSDCTTTTLAIATNTKTNRTLSAGGYAIERVDSVPSIDTLDLTQNAVSALPDLSSYASIKRLVLAGNRLTTLKSITFPKTLTDLDLSNNALAPTKALGSLSSLTTLTLTNTSLADLSTIALPPTLQTLTVSFNQLTKFPASPSLPSLTTLTLTTNSIASFADIAMPPSLVSLDLSWNALASFDGLNLPKSVTKLYIGGNRFTSLADLKTSNELTVLYAHDLMLGNLDGVKIPDSVSALSLMNCSLTTLSNMKLPTSLVYLDISKNQLTELPRSYPDSTKSITANNNQLTQLAQITFSTSITKMDFSGNAIAKVAGVVFPMVLETLNFGAFPISEFEIRRSDLTTIQKLTALNATITQTTCANEAAQSVLVQGVLVCVIPDEVFAAQYGTSSGSAAFSNKVKSSSSWVVPMLVCLGALVVLAAAVFLWRRRKATRHMPKQPQTQNHAQTLANPSVFGDLPQFTDRGKQQSQLYASQHNNIHNNQFNQQAATTINSFNSMFSSGHHDSGGVTLNNSSSGPEASLLKYRIQTHEVTLQRALAHGGFGAVYLATYQMQDVVVKKILPEKASDDRCLQAFLDEIKLNSTLNHPKVVRFIGVSWNTLSDIAVIMEFMPNGDLDTLLKQFSRKAAVPRDPSEFGWFTSPHLPSKSALALDILDAVVYLHSFSSPIIHRDLKAKNVLLGHNYMAKLSDFGVSREWQVDATMTAGIGTMAWIAPEVLRGERYTEKADMYSFGVILTELATCAKPFEGISNALIVLKVTSGEHRPDMGDDCPDDIRELGVRCLSYDAGDRPSAMVAHYELKTLLKAHAAFEL